MNDVRHIKILIKEDGDAFFSNPWSSVIFINKVRTEVASWKTVHAGDELIITESVVDSTFRHWEVVELPLISGVSAKIIEMPSMNKFTKDKAGTIAGNCFFDKFNYCGLLSSLPEGSFDTSKIIEVGDNFFAKFNSGGTLADLPENSFNLSNIVKAGSNFFHEFNCKGWIESLPAGSFNISNIKLYHSGFFSAFNERGRLKRLPAGSFDITGMNKEIAYFFRNFNRDGDIALDFNSLQNAGELFGVDFKS